MIRENFDGVKERIRRAAEKAGRDPRSIRLVAVTKEAGIDEIREAAEAGATDVGENRVKDALSKKALLDSSALTWHMIGHLQSRKAKEAVRIFSLIHSVDSLKLAYIINTEAKKTGKTQDVLLEVNVSGEESKFGIKPDALAGFLKEAESFKNIDILGLMTMAPFAENAESARPYFRELKELASTYCLKELSMGMTQDFEVAVE